MLLYNLLVNLLLGTEHIISVSKTLVVPIYKIISGNGNSAIPALVVTICVIGKTSM